MKAKVNIRDFIEENADHNDMLLVHASVDVEDLFDTNCIPEEHEFDIDMDEMLADNLAIGIVWDIGHVKDQRPDLTDEQAWEVLQECQSSWDRLNDPMLETIRQVAENLHPTGKEALRRRIRALLSEVESLPERECDNPAAYGEAAAKLDALNTVAKGA
jgi:hypothetical protein